MTLGLAEMDNIATRALLRGLRTEADYDIAVSAMNGLMNGLMDAGAASETHPLAGLLSLLGDLIGDDEDARGPMPKASPAEMIRLLMDQHGLRQGDLPEIGSQGVVSEVLSGKRALNAGQIGRPAARFGIGPSAFLTSA